MESILLAVKAVEFYALAGAVVVMAGGLVIAMLHKFIRGKVREVRAIFTSPWMVFFPGGVHSGQDAREPRPHLPSDPGIG
jgi:hypothetical protein